MKELPAPFLHRMRELLGEEYDSFLSEYEKEPLRGIRLNPLKCSADTLRKCFPFLQKESPYSPLSYVFSKQDGKIGRHPLHHAGAVYSQEPSAAAAVTALSPHPGEKVLDLCAAPGGKSTQIASLLQGEGLIWSNEIIKSRAQVLLSNMERMGVRNGVISSCRPEQLCEGLEGFFDCVLVDAPCSGEGMFRKDARAVEEWSPEHSSSCAVRQRAILESAAKALRPGGRLLYSTCTFAPEENEETVLAFLRAHPSFELLDTGLSAGRPSMGKMRRIYPMDGGEGHFVALMRKTEKTEGKEKNCPPPLYRPGTASMVTAAEALWNELMKTPFPGNLEQRGNYLYILPKGVPVYKGLGVLRAGVQAFEIKGTRLEPCHHLFMSASPEALRSRVELPWDAPETAAFLRGEEISAAASLKGWTGVSVEGVMLGFGKAGGGKLKNRYPKGLRNHV